MAQNDEDYINRIKNNLKLTVELKIGKVYI